MVLIVFITFFNNIYPHILTLFQHSFFLLLSLLFFNNQIITLILTNGINTIENSLSTYQHPKIIIICFQQTVDKE